MNDIWPYLLITYGFISFVLLCGFFYVIEENDGSHAVAWVVGWPLFGSIWLARALWREFIRVTFS